MPTGPLSTVPRPLIFSDSTNVIETNIFKLYQTKKKKRKKKKKKK